MKRIAIIVPPGSGKSTFARELSRIYNLPIVHLDFYYHQTGQNYQTNNEAWIVRVKQLISQDKWIIDGNYSSTLKERSERADLVIFLDFPKRTYMSGIMKRWFEYYDKTRSDMPADWKERMNFEFVNYVWHFKSRERHKITDKLDIYDNDKVKVLHSRKAAKVYLNTLRANI